MKRIYIIILLSFFALFSFPQAGDMYADGMTWVVRNVYFTDDGEISEYNEMLMYVVQGDTTVNDTKYKKMECHYFDNDDNRFYFDYTYLVRYSDGKHLFYLPEYKYVVSERCYIDDDYVMFDENLNVGDALIVNPYEKIACISDTVFGVYSSSTRKCWKMQPYSSSSTLYTQILNRVVWVEGIGNLMEPVPAFINEYDCPCYNMLVYCVNAAGDTIYHEPKYNDFPLCVPKIEALEFTIAQQDGECVVTLPVAAEWAVTLYNAAGISVACKAGEGSEIFLPVDGKGTHILVLEVGGKQYTKKVMIR